MKGKIIERLKRLLRMAKDSSSPHEASIARKRADRLMKKYGIREEDISMDEPAPSAMSARKYGRAFAAMPDYYQTLAINVARYTDTQVMRSDDQLEFQGVSIDVSLAHYLMDILQEQTEMLLKSVGGREIAFLKATDDDFDEGEYRRNFRLGCVAGMCERLKEFYGERISNSKDIVAKQKAVEEYFGKTEHSQAQVKPTHGIAAGYLAGREANVSWNVYKEHYQQLPKRCDHGKSGAEKDRADRVES